MNITKKLAVLLFFILAFFIIPTNIKASESNFLAGLPYNQPINHDYSYDDFVDKANIVVFGRTEVCYNTMNYIPTADSLITNNNLSDQVNLLFFDIDQSINDIQKYLDSQSWKHVTTFSGGSSEMWEILRDNGIESSVTLPVVVYISADDEVINVTTGYQNQHDIANEIKQLVGWLEDEHTTEASQDIGFKVLADVEGADFTTRKSEIIKKLQAIDKTSEVAYDIAPKITAPYAAGTMKQSYQQNALNTLNLVRYLSGLPAVSINEEYASYAQHGAVLMKASGYGHYPSQPADMNTAFFDIGYQGTSKGNIYYGYFNLYHAIIDGWMADEDPSNIDRLGHRRWALNPQMSSTGFGEANKLGVMYALDRSATAPEYDAIAYPSGAAFPSELFKGDYPWNVSLNPYLFETPNINEVTVTLIGGGKTYTFSINNSSINGNYFNVDTAGYGINNSIIFRPNGIEEYSGTYKVNIDGLKTLMGQPVSLSYETTFFNASIQYKQDKPSEWAQSGIERFYQLNLLPETLVNNFRAPITRAEFSQLAVRLYESKKGTIQATAKFSDTTDPNVLKMATLGIVTGTGNGKFNPNEKITREQAAKILDLLLETLGQAPIKGSVSYSDQSRISTWAAEYVNSVSNRGIMGGVSGNKFDPKGYFTREQSILTMLRIWDSL